MAVLEKFYRLLLEFHERVDKFPRSRKYNLGDRILGNLYQTLELMIIAKYSKERRGHLREINLRLEIMRFHLRLCHDCRVISTKAYELLYERVNEIGGMIGAIIKREKDRLE
ncbi:MAG: diversity-generating retroelement protein Avd [Deltaproteobacteria bacterium]|nr:diversity-generating retroelement protein Avd [Deltaproteobacteria bacterium]